MARRPVAVLAALLGTGAAAGLVWLGLQLSGDREDQPAGPTISARTAPSHPAAPMGPRPSGCQLQSGQTLAYALDIRTQAELHPERLNLPPGARLEGPPPSRATTATLDLKVLRAEASGAVLLARFGQVDPGTVREVGALDAPFLLRVNDCCKVSGFARLDTTGSIPARTQQALAHELQWTWPAEPTATDEGETAFGRYRASYTVGATSVERRIDAYTKVWERAQGFSGASTEKPAASHMRVHPGQGPWFESLSSREKIVGMALVDTDTTTEVTSRPPSAEALDDAPTDEQRYVWENTFAKKLGRLAQRPQNGPAHVALVEQMRKVTLPVALDQMYDAINQDANIGRVWPLLEAFLEAHPEQAQVVVDQLRAGAIPDGAVAATFIALGQTPTTQARDALWGLKDDKAAGTILRAQSAFALVDRADVGVSLARSLLEDSRAVSSGGTRAARLFAREAALALGMLSGLKADDDEIRAVATSGALALLKEGRDASSLSPGLNAVANIGDPALLPHVLPFTRNADPKVRQAATKVIRRMPPIETASTTADWLARENDPLVKRALYKTLAAQLSDAQEVPDGRIVERAIHDLGAEPSTLTRQSLIHILGGVAANVPRAREALIRQVKRESQYETGLLKQLGQYLSAEDIARGMVM